MAEKIDNKVTEKISLEAGENQIKIEEENLYYAKLDEVSKLNPKTGKN